MEDQNTIIINDENVSLAEKTLKGNYKKAEEILNTRDKIEELLQRAEKKLQGIKFKKIRIPKLNIEADPNQIISYIILMISLIRMYVVKKYTKIPVGTIIAVISAILYLVAPIDLIADYIPVIGLVDDAAVILFCAFMVKSDLDNYAEWKAENNI